MERNKAYQFWFCPGSVDLYSEREINVVTEHCGIIVAELNKSSAIPFEIVLKPTLLTSENIRRTFNDANEDPACAGVIAWMHMFSPAKSWLAGLNDLRKPLLHFATQFNEEMPYATLDMDFININQSAHGDREFAYMLARMNKQHKTIMGHWSHANVQKRLGQWMRTAVGIVESNNLRILRLSDNMRNVADTEGDKLDAQIRFGWQCDTWSINDYAECVHDVTPAEVRALTDEYYAQYKIMLNGRDPEEFRRHVEVQAQIEIGSERFMREKNYQAIVTNFPDLGALKQLPGLAMQRLMAKGYGFAAEGDWKTAALLRLVNLMTSGMENIKGASFMEDYTYNLVPGEEGVLETHMLEVSPAIADGEIGIRVEPLGLGGREDPARLVFTAKTGKATASTMVDMGDHFRLLVNDVQCKKTKEKTPNLPVGSAFWTPEPNFYTGVEAWLIAGGCHHSVLSYDLTSEQLCDWGEAMGIETVLIDKDTTIPSLKRDLKLGRLLYR